MLLTSPRPTSSFTLIIDQTFNRISLKNDTVIPEYDFFRFIYCNVVNTNIVDWNMEKITIQSKIKLYSIPFHLALCFAYGRSVMCRSRFVYSNGE